MTVARPRVIFLNGAFGAGKTTVAKELRSLNSKFVIHDPERVGFILQRLPLWRARSGDFQEIGLWRNWVTKAIKARATAFPSKMLVVPMTLIAPRTREVIVGYTHAQWPDRVFEIWLGVSPDVLRRRLLTRDGDDASWALGQLDACRRFEEELPSQLIILSGEDEPSAIARQIEYLALSSNRVLSQSVREN